MALLISGALLKQVSRDGSWEVLIQNVCQFPCAPTVTWLISTYQHITKLEVRRRCIESLEPAGTSSPSIPLLLAKLIWISLFFHPRSLFCSSVQWRILGLTSLYSNKSLDFPSLSWFWHLNSGQLFCRISLNFSFSQLHWNCALWATTYHRSEIVFSGVPDIN